eukprot:jgi/Undpi1/8013/HiC_scaffold_24.g10485.m1
MQFTGSAGTTHNAEVDMPAADDMIDVGGAWAAVAAAAASVSPVDDETVAVAPEKEPYVPATGGALDANMNEDASPFEVDIGSGDSYEDLIASGVIEFLDVFRELDDGPAGGCFPEGGLNAGNQDMETDDDEFAWLNSPDAFMPLPIGDADALGQAPATVDVPTGEETGMGPGVEDDDMEEHVAQAPLAEGWAVPEAAQQAAPAAAAAVAATTILPPVALEGDMAEGTGGENAVTPAPAYDFSEGGEGGGGAGYMFAEGPPDGAADAGAAGVGVAAAEAMAVTPMATNMTMVNGAGGDEDNGGLSQKELLRRQKVERYLAKKKSRRWSRASSYQSRQRVANNRPRHKGRFLPLVSDFVPISELKRRQRALMAQQAAEEEERQASFPTLDAPPGGWGASAQFTGVEDYGQGDG